MRKKITKKKRSERKKQKNSKQVKLVKIEEKSQEIIIRKQVNNKSVEQERKK